MGLVLGFVALVLGAEGLVRGSLSLAQRLRLPPMLVGLTIVAMGTSMPELVVSTIAAWQGKSDIAIANVVGSNTFNILCVLGLPALIKPLVLKDKAFQHDSLVMVLVSVLALGLAFTGATITSIEAAVLAVGLVIYLIDSYRRGTAEMPEVVAAPALWRSGLYVVGGVALLALGGHWVVEASAALARTWGVSDRVIGLTIVAIGTSLPELVTSLVATVKGQTEVAIGNVIGSNIFNLLGILGFAGLIQPLTVEPSLLQTDLPFMVAIAILVVPIIRWHGRLGRFDGLLLLVLYGLYTLFILQRAIAGS